MKLLNGQARKLLIHLIFMLTYLNFYSFNYEREF